MGNSRVLVASPAKTGGGVERVAEVLAKECSKLGYKTTVKTGLLELLVPVTRCLDFHIAATWKTHIASTARFQAKSCAIFVHGAEITRGNAMESVARRAAFREAGRLLAISPFAVHVLEENLGLSATLVGPPILCIPPVANSSRTASTVRLVCVGRVEERKGAFRAIQVAKQLADSGPDAIELDILGTGPEFEKLLQATQMAKSPRLAIRVHGRVSDSIRINIIRQADVNLFLPFDSGSEYEGLGLSPLEAAGLGVPSVVTKSGGSAFSVSVASGILVDWHDNDDSARAAEAVMTLVGDQRFRFTAHQWASSFQSERFAQRVLMACSDEPIAWDWPV